MENKGAKVFAKRILIFLLFLSITPLFGSSKTIISGTLTDQNGSQFKKADIIVYSLVTNKVVEKIPLKSKNYKVEFEEKGMYEIRFCAPFHIAHSITVYVKDHFKEKVNVKMSPFEINENLDNLKVTFDPGEGRIYLDMKKGNEGKYHASFKSDRKEIDYQIARLEKTGHAVNGTKGKIIKLDDSGDYYSTIKSDKGVFNFVFDPALLLKKKNESEIKYLNEKSTVKTINYLKEMESFYEKDLKKTKSDYLASGKSRRDFKYDASKLENVLEKYINSENKETQKIGLAFYLRAKDIINHNARYDSKKYKSYYKKYFELVSPASDLWSLTPFIFISNPTVRNNYRLKQYYKEFFAKNKNRKMKVRHLTQEYAFAKNFRQKKEMEWIRKVLKEEYSDMKEYKSFIKRFPD